MAARDTRPTAASSGRTHDDGAGGGFPGPRFPAGVGEIVRAPARAEAEPAAGTTRRQAAAEVFDRVLDGSLVCIRDLAGRPRGTGFAADHHGTVLTSHEAVDGLTRLVAHAPGAGGRSCVVNADAVTPLPGLDLALLRTEGLGVEPLPVFARDAVVPGAYVRIAAGGWREARVLGPASVTYTATEGRHLIDGALELAIGTAGRDALRRGGGTAGGPVLDAATGTVVAVLGTALRSGDRDARFAVPLRAPALGPARAGGTVLTEGPLADLLARNAATVPAYGPGLNLAAVLELTATSVAQDGPHGALPRHAAPTAPTAHTLFSGPYARPARRPRTEAPAASGPGPAQTPALRVGAATPGPGAAAPRDPAFHHPGRIAIRVERTDVARELDAFGGSGGPAGVLGLVGAPGSGRTTELAALTGRRARGDAPTPTLWLRGADLDGADDSVADAAGRALDRAARIVAAARLPFPTELADLTPERVARLAHAHGRPLLLLLDGPEEMPAALDHRLAEWTDGTARWLRGTGARLVVACREEYWESAGSRFPAGLLHIPAQPDGVRAVPAGLPPCLRLGHLTPDEARAARLRHGVPDGALVDADAGHPLTLSLLAEVRAALPGLPAHPPLDRADVLAAHLDLMCLRIAVRLAAENDLRGTAVRRLAARVSGQVHEAARRSIGPGGALDRATFEGVFPWGPAPARLGGGTGWASAVLTEGLLVPAGDGYRFAHEELADWIQGAHLDLDEALRVLVHRRHIPGETRPLPPVPHHRIGPVVQALLLLARQHGTRRLAVRLEELVCALDADPGAWWPSRLLTGALLRVPDARPYTGVLRLLAERIVTWQQCDLPVPDGFGPGFWTALHLPPADHCDLLRRLLLADPAPRAHPGPASSGAAGADSVSEACEGVPQGAVPSAPPAPRPPRYLDAAARLLAADPAAVQPHLVRWFDDGRPLPAAPDATVATAAQALLHTHRHRAPDDLTETLVESAHERADELLAALAEEEPAALCRAVARWARDERPDRRAAAVAHALRAVSHVRTDADLEALCDAALTLLARPADAALHGGALALLVADPRTRARHLPQALRHFTTGDTTLPPSALAPALATHPEAVLAAFGERLRHGPGTGADEALRVLADASPAALAPRVAALISAAVARRPDTAGQVAAYVERRLRTGPAVRAALFPLLSGLLEGGPTPLRAALGAVLATPGAPDGQATRRELLGLLLAHETDPAVLDAVLHTAARGAEEDLGDLVRRVGLLLARTPEGAAAFDRGLAELGRQVPGFAARVAGWLTDAPQDWAAVVGPGARRTLLDLAGAPAALA